MKNSTIKLLTLAFVLVLGVSNLKAQSYPTSVTVTPSNGTSTSLPKDDGSTDLITAGTKVPYMVYPDKDLNPSWSEGTDAKNTTGIVSTFNWAVSVPAIGTISATKHYMELSAGTAGTTGTITVQEIGTCNGTTTTINVKVISQPTVSAASVSASSQCATAGVADGSLNITPPTFSVTKTTDGSITGDPLVKVIASLDVARFPSGTANIFKDQECTIDNATGNITLPAGTKLNYWGTYTLTISKVSDRISRKDVSSAGGYFASSASVTYVVTKAPVTGPIYHLSN